MSAKNINNRPDIRPKEIFDKVRQLNSEGKCQHSKNLLDKHWDNLKDLPVANLYSGICCMYLNRVEEAKEYFSEAHRLSPNNYLAEDYLTLCSFMLGDDAVLEKIKIEKLHASKEFTAFLYRALTARIVSAGLENGEVKPYDGEEISASDYAVGACSDSESPESSSGGKTSAFSLISLAEEMMSYIYFTIGKITADRELYPQAEVFFRKALAYSDNIRRIRYCFGETLFFLKKYDEALLEFRKAEETEGEAPETMYYLGITLKELGKYDEAERYLFKAIDAFSKFPEAYFTLGEIAVIKGTLDKSLEYFMKTASGDAVILDELLKKAREKLL